MFYADAIGYLCLMKAEMHVTFLANSDCELSINGLFFLHCGVFVSSKCKMNYVLI